MNRPVIGLTASHDLKSGGLAMNPLYPNAIRRFGGLPLILPLELSGDELEALSQNLDGVLFTGGPDIHPFIFGEETLRGCGDMSPLRDQLELSLFRKMYDKKKPILGICRGIQLINIALGGNIYQDLDSQFHKEHPIAHRQPFSCKSPSHTVAVVPGTKLSKISPAPVLEVNSMHHQAVRDLAPGLTACAHASGGLTEALESPGYPFLLAVQWHPEYLVESEPHAQNLFQAFVDACRQGGTSRCALS